VTNTKINISTRVQLLNLVCIVLRGRPAYVVAKSIAVPMYKREVLNLVSNAMTRESDGVYRVGTAIVTGTAVRTHTSTPHQF
jgi:hypothetical protein